MLNKNQASDIGAAVCRNGMCEVWLASMHRIGMVTDCML